MKELCEPESVPRRQEDNEEGTPSHTQTSVRQESDVLEDDDVILETEPKEDTATNGIRELVTYWGS